MTKGLQETEIIETNPEKEKINGFFEQSVKEMKYLKDSPYYQRLLERLQ